jgi:hypothetical protein
MTMIITVLLGAGILLLISAIENISIVCTFQNIMAGKPLDTKCA